MDSEGETPVMDVLLWLGRVAPEDARQLLVGCSLDDGQDEEVVEIVDLAHERQAVTLAGGRRVLLRAVRDGVVVDARPGAPLAKAVVGSWTQQEREDRADALELARVGLPAGKLASRVDRAAVLEFVRIVDGGGLPDEAGRRAFYLALRASDDAGLARVGARLLGVLIERFAKLGAVPEDLHWRLARFLRRAGNLDDAIAASEVLHTGGLRNVDARKLLATTRAAALLDLYGVRADGTILDQAERALKVAWALGPGDEEAKQLYHRLRQARGGDGFR